MIINGIPHQILDVYVTQFYYKILYDKRLS
jgi:hypothetical protein